MKRDMDLIRSLLLEIEEKASGPFAGLQGLEIDGHDHATVTYHLLLLKDARLAEMEIFPIDETTYGHYINGLTWSGHEFLDAVRSPEVWSRTKTSAEAAGGFTVDLLKDLAKGFIRKQVEELTGVKL